MKIISYDKIHYEENNVEIALLRKLGAGELIQEKTFHDIDGRRKSLAVPARWEIELDNGTTVYKWREAVDRARGIFLYTYRLNLNGEMSSLREICDRYDIFYRVRKESGEIYCYAGDLGETAPREA